MINWLLHPGKKFSVVFFIAFGIAIMAFVYFTDDGDTVCVGAGYTRECMSESEYLQLVQER